MKKATRTTLTVISGLLLALGLAWMIFLAVTQSPFAMTVIPAAMVCGAAAIALAKLDEQRNQEKQAHSTPVSDAHSRAA